MIRKNAYMLLLFFCAMGLLVSLSALKQHYAPVGSSACNVSATFDCDAVNKSEWSELFGFPVAGIGVVGYLVLAIVAVAYARDRDRVLGKALLFLCAGALLFSLYLTSIEAHVLGVWCLLCLASLSAITGAAFTALLIFLEWNGEEG